MLSETTLVMAVSRSELLGRIGAFLKHSSRVLLKSYGKDVVAVPENFTLLEISMWSWG